MNDRTPKLPTLGVKPSKAALVGLAVVQAEKREAYVAALNAVVKGREIETSLARRLREEDPEAIQTIKAQKDEEYAEAFEKTIKEFIPDISSYLP